MQQQAIATKPEPFRFDGAIVADWFKEAAKTLRNLPPVKAQGYRTNWPNVVQDIWDAYGWNDICLNRTKPTPAEIDRLDIVIEWTQWLEEKERKILWMRSFGTRWKIICHKVGMQRTKAHIEFKYACVRIATLMNDDNVPYTKKKKNVRTLLS